MTSSVMLQLQLPATWLPIGTADAVNLLGNGGFDFLLRPPPAMVEPLDLSSVDLDPQMRAFFIALPANPEAFMRRGVVAGSVAVLKCENFHALARAVEEQNGGAGIVPHVKSSIGNIGMDACLDVEEMFAQPERDNRVVFRRWSVRRSSGDRGVVVDIATIEPLLIQEVRELHRSIIATSAVDQEGS